MVINYENSCSGEPKKSYWFNDWQEKRRACTATVSTTTANVFTFGITNNSGTSQVVNWGYTTL